MPLSKAAAQGLVSAKIYVEESTLYTQSPKLEETFTIETVVRPDTGVKMSVKEAMDAGILDMENNCIIDPRTGQSIL